MKYLDQFNVYHSKLENKLGTRAKSNRIFNFFYKNSKCVSFFIIVIIIYCFGYFRNNVNIDDNIWTGYQFLSLLVLSTSALVAPNGPIHRPHPVFWRLIFGLSVLYVCGFVYIVFQNHETIKAIIYWFYPNLEFVTNVFEKPYDINCADLSWNNIGTKIDVYTIGHALGWIIKAVIVRHYGILWLLSITWEVSELAFAHLLPFRECWWDTLILDLLLTNGMGIYIGMKICQLFKLEFHEWDGFSDGVLPAHANYPLLSKSWSSFLINCFNNTNFCVRVLELTFFNILWQITEIDVFFLMNIFDFPAAHPISLIRLTIIALILIPTVKEYVNYITGDNRSNQVGTQAIILCTMIVTEAVLVLKYDPTIIPRLKILNIILWIIIQFFFSIICLTSCLIWQKLQNESNSE